MIALNLVCYNEEERIYECMKNASQWVDEIVIVDQSSTDDTIERINYFATRNDIKPKIVNDIHRGFCEPSRKLCAARSESDWILVLDADEQISPQFGAEMGMIQQKYLAARMIRSFWLDGQHRFTGDSQLRFFNKNHVEFLDVLHTDPQFKMGEDYAYHPDYICIYHNKSVEEQLADELRYESLTDDKTKRDLNVHLKLIRDQGLSVEDVLAMSPEEKRSVGL